MPGPLSATRDDHLLVLLAGAHADLPFVGETGGIAEQVKDHLADARAVGSNWAQLGGSSTLSASFFWLINGRTTSSASLMVAVRSSASRCSTTLPDCSWLRASTSLTRLAR